MLNIVKNVCHLFPSDFSHWRYNLGEEKAQISANCSIRAAVHHNKEGVEKPVQRYGVDTPHGL